MKLSERPTPDLVVMFLAGVVGLIMLITTLAVIFIAIYQPTVDDSKVIQRIGTLVSNLIGAIIGYMAGRSVARDEER